MEKIDPQKAAAVWQRVQGSMPSPPSSPPLSAMIQDELANGVTYRKLSQQLTGSSAAILQQLSRQSFSRVACLKGIYRMLSGSPIAAPMPVYAAQDPQSALRRCYGREMQSLARYESYRSDPEYGRIFVQLAAQGQIHCKQLLEILGNLK